MAVFQVVFLLSVVSVCLSAPAELTPKMILANHTSLAPVQVLVPPTVLVAAAPAVAAVRPTPQGRADAADSEAMGRSNTYTNSLEDALGLMNTVLAPRFMQPSNVAPPTSTQAPQLTVPQQPPMGFQPQQPLMNPAYLPMQGGYPQQQPAAYLPAQQGLGGFDQRMMPLGNGYGQQMYNAQVPLQVPFGRSLPSPSQQQPAPMENQFNMPRQDFNQQAMQNPGVQQTLPAFNGVNQQQQPTFHQQGQFPSNQGFQG